MKDEVLDILVIWEYLNFEDDDDDGTSATVGCHYVTKLMTFKY